MCVNSIDIFLNKIIQVRTFYDVIVVQKKFQFRRKIHILWVGLFLQMYVLETTAQCVRYKMH